MPGRSPIAATTTSRTFARASAFECALNAMMAFGPDQVLIACNTLSIVYEHTGFRNSPPVPVRGIIDGGVDLFRERLTTAPASSILLMGTRTTIESGVHRRRLIDLGISGDRIAALACHGLAASIERGPRSAATASILDECATRASQEMLGGDPSYIGLCCTHYGLVSGDISRAIDRAASRPVQALDPNERMAREVVDAISQATPSGRVSVEVISKVAIEESSREALGAFIEPISPETAAALRAYTWVPDLF